MELFVAVWLMFSEVEKIDSRGKENIKVDATWVQYNY